MQIKKPNLAGSFKLPNPSLRAYLHRNVVGSSEDYRTPFWDKAPREEILAKGDVIFENWYKGANPDIFESLYAYEKEMRSKVGPYSIQAPLEERMDSIKEYGTLSQFKGSKLPEGFAEVLKEFKSISGIRVRSALKTVENMKLSTNSGSPFFTRRRLVAKQTLEGLGHSYSQVAVLGGRGQEGGPQPSDVKQRVVFMMPFELNIQELRVYQPMIEAIQRFNLIPAYVSLDSVERRVTALFDSKDPKDLVIATDFTKMDHHFNRTMQDTAETIIGELLTRDELSQGGLREVFRLKFTIPLLCSEDLIITGDHGMGSGSGGTNLDETFAHRSLQYTAAINDGQNLNINSQCLGDDGILSYPGITIDAVTRTYTSFGMDMNPDKQYAATTHTVYLRRGYHTGFRDNLGVMRGVYSTYRALGRLMGQERFYDPKVGGPKMITLRAGSILENCANSPLFEQLVDFVLEGDKYRLGLSIPGFIKNVNAEFAKAKAKISNFTSYTQDIMNDNQGIESGRVYRYLKSKL